jgi:hypothetical protein
MSKKDMSSTFNSMWCVSAVWNGQKSFKLVPITEECPYVEMIYDPEVKMMVIISKLLKEAYHMLPKIDDNGDVMPAKNRKNPEKNYKEERRLVDSYQEYYIISMDEIKTFIKMFASNADSFDLSILDAE